MPRQSDKRERLLAAAKTLFHEHGYYRTSLADIAECSCVPVGNVYYYFKTKDELAEAVIAERLAELRGMLTHLDGLPDPRQRLLGFIDMPEDMMAKVVEHGCPVGSLAQEMCKENSSIQRKMEEILGLELDWLSRQFRLLGSARPGASARQMLARLQGTAMLANALGDAGVIEEQLGLLREWLRQP